MRSLTTIGCEMKKP